ncbi:MAG TPA: hypothetical protein VGD89_05005 [Flavipsychrobacter sp.]
MKAIFIRMKWRLLLLSQILAFTCVAQSFETTFEKSGGTQSVSYKDLIDFYTRLDKQYNTIQMDTVGPTDAYYPLQVVYYSNSGKFNLQEWKAEAKLVILVNNGIHPGEPDGIDASMLLLRDLATGKITVPDNIALAVVPVFNIGGMLNRGSYSRANQNGPTEYGFRGNAQNLDLNRDFIKMDALETQSLAKLFHMLDPDLFIDNHVSNGADYQHVMTLLSTLHGKLGGTMGNYLHQTLEPAIYAEMEKKRYNMVPYVNHWGHTPDNGWMAFHEGPRFASGFSTLFHTYGFVPETHMLKPFRDRTIATYELMRSFLNVAAQQAPQIKSSRSAQQEQYLQRKFIPIAWQVDTTQYTNISFHGYEAGYKRSEVSGQPRLYYDRSKPYKKQVKLRDTYHVKDSVTVPVAYIIPRGWHRVIERLRINGVRLQEMQQDSLMQVTTYRIEHYETTPRPYEGHYLHSNVKVSRSQQYVKLLKGDYMIPVNQPAARYIIETLEPTAPDAFFAWGFFDAVLQQKEYYSDYVFEDEAAKLLQTDKTLYKKLNDKKQDPTFANDGQAQLDFVYRNSPYYEPVHMRYPVFRIEK